MGNPSQDLEKERPGRRNNTHKTHSEVSLVLPGTERRFSRTLQVGEGRYVGGTNETQPLENEDFKFHKDSGSLKKLS